jgi:hypothetical protein
MNNVQYAAYGMLCALISAKWAMELGVSQFRQLLFGLAGAMFGPLTLLILYVYLLSKAEKRGRPSAKWI